jgi:glucose-6-phosphate 1-epimerase
MKVSLIEFANLGPAVLLQASDGATATVCLHGGQVVSWCTADGEERIFVSSKASAVAAIRGGIPVCFPQFATLGPLAKHGYARTSQWRHKASGRFVLDVPPGLWAGFPHACALVLDVTLGPATLSISLTVENVGPTSFSFTGALHTYLRVADVKLARVDGWAGQAISFGTEVDLSFSNVSHPAMLTIDGEPNVLCAQTGFTDGVVWNIGPELETSLRDLGSGEWKSYVCVEAAVLQPTLLGSGERWNATQCLVALNM